MSCSSFISLPISFFRPCSFVLPALSSFHRCHDRSRCRSRCRSHSIVLILFILVYSSWSIHIHLLSMFHPHHSIHIIVSSVVLFLSLLCSPHFRLHAPLSSFSFQSSFPFHLVLLFILPFSIPLPSSAYQLIHSYSPSTSSSPLISSLISLIPSLISLVLFISLLSKPLSSLPSSL